MQTRFLPPKTSSIVRSLWQSLAVVTVALSTVLLADGAIAQEYAVGSEGVEVIELQRALNSYYGSTVVAETGFYDLLTEQVVRDFQARAGLAVDGIAGSQTLRALGLISNVGGYSSGVSITSFSTTVGFNTADPVCANQELCPYVVVIPGHDDDDLVRAREVVSDARPERSGRGNYIYAGAFLRRSEAEARAIKLRQADLDARVAYFR